MSTAELLPNLYGTIGTTPDVDAEGLADAYRSAARRAHPDVGGSHEQFVAVDLAWRILRDHDTRRRFDALWRLQTATQSSAKYSMPEIRQLFDDADSAVFGWRVPAELRAGVDALLEESRRWVERVAAASTGSRSSHERSSASSRSTQSERTETEQTLRDSIERVVAYFREAVKRDMAEWPEVLDRIRSGGTVKVRQAALSHGYRTYTALRRLQDTLELARKHSVLTTDDLRLQFHVSEAILNVRALLIAAQSEFGRSYSFKNEKWLIDTRNRARRELDSRSVAVGDPPWGTSTPSPKASRNASESARSRADSSKGSGGTHRSKERMGEDPVPTNCGARTTRAGGRPKWVGPVAVGTIAAICITMVTVAPEESAEVFSSVLAVAMLAGLTWILATSADARRLLGLLLIGTVKISWFMVRGLAAILAGLIGLVFRR